MVSAEIIERFRTLLGRVNCYAGHKEAWQEIRALSEEASVTRVAFLNAHGAYLASHDHEFCSALISSEMVLQDGAGIELARAHLNLPQSGNLNGTDFIPYVLTESGDMPVALIGSEDKYLDAAVRVVAGKFRKRVVFTAHGFSEHEQYVALLQSALSKEDACLVILAMGMPHQELLAATIAEQWSGTDARLIVLNGGAIVDFMAKRFPRAPTWMRKARMEWIFRFICEPRRLFRRYTYEGMQFLRMLRAAEKKGR